MVNQKQTKNAPRASSSAKYRALVEQHRSRVLSRTLKLTRLVHDEQALVAFSLSGNATFAAKHLTDGRTDGFPKGHWLSQKAYDTTFAEGGIEKVEWICPNAWWHFQEITINGGAVELERHYRAIKSAAAAITLDGDTSVRIEIKEDEFELCDADLQVLAEIWPAPRAEAA